MPRVSAQHEQAVRDRIVRAAIEVFAEHGFHRATMQDIVRKSGLSVGAIYTYFKSKSELILAGCDLITDQELGELRERLATVTDFRERVATALGFFFDQFEEQRSGTGTSVLMTLAWAEVDADPAIREMVRRRRREIVGPTALLLQEGVVRGELPPWLDVESVAHAFAALLDGLTIEAIEDGACLPPRGRGEAGPGDPGVALRGSGRRAAGAARSDGAAALRLAQGEPGVVTDAHVQTVRGPIDPGSLGFTLPHEHTAIALWHIPNRWDYWELRRDEPIITAELARFREKGGTCLVDLTLPGVGRDPDWLAGLSAATGLDIVMGAGWYRDAYYPPEALIDRRTVDDLADEIVREASEGVAGSGIKAGIIGEIGTDKPWLSAREERVHRAAARAARRTRSRDHDPRGPVERRARSAHGLRGGGRRPLTSRHRPRRLLPRPGLPSGDRGPRRLGRVRLPRHELHPAGAPRRGPDRRIDLRPARRGPRRADPALAGRLSRLPAGPATAATVTRTWPTRSCRACGPPGSPTTRSGRSPSTTRGGS